MKDEANDFLKKSGELYELNKRKWSKILKEKGLEFSEDIYNDAILKTYDAILKKETNMIEGVGYWFQTFINNTKRDKLYARNKVDSSDAKVVLKEKEDKENEVNLYYSTISSILLKVRKNFDRKTFEAYRMYLLCDMSYEQLNILTGMNDCKQRINKVRKWLNDNKI